MKFYRTVNKYGRYFYSETKTEAKNNKCLEGTPVEEMEMYFNKWDFISFLNENCSEHTGN